MFEVNSGIGEYASDVYALLHTAVEKFKQTEVVITQDVFANLPLTETEVSDLVENLRFNEYIDEKNVLLNNALLLQITAEDLLLELRFYPHRHKILTAIQAHIEGYKDELYIFKKEQFFDIADQLVADWTFEAIASQYLQEGYILEQHRDYFRNPENASTLDIAWPFEPNHNRVVFERIRSIIQTADKYCLTNTPFELFKFDESEINELIDILIDTGYLTHDRKIPSDQIPYFLNINNALEFVVQAFEDYNKDVFFMLHAIAKQVDQTTQAIATLYQGLIDGQKNALYQPLQEAFGLPSDSIAAIFKQVFGEAANVQEEWLLPILQTVNIHDRIDQEPDSSRFNTAYRRIQQFALLATKLKLDQDAIEIAFHDQNLAEKYPESIELPAVTTADGHRKAITSFDALLESEDGRIYLFKSADTTHDSAQYWVYSAITHELIETEDNNLSTLLTGNQTTTVNLTQVNAAFVDKQGRDVLIVDGQYYVKVPAKDGSVWQIHEREWGRVDSDFENLPVIDGAFTDESGRTYLFANDQYVRYSNGIEV
ncbi:MAG: hemopexin repeat-containing protein [Leptolyngbyaceae cyanobacterium]